MHFVVRYATLALLGLCGVCHAHTDRHEAREVDLPVNDIVSIEATRTLGGSSTYTQLLPTFGNGTCQSRTVNYITHTLPKQCLKTDRASSKAGQDSVTAAVSNPSTTNVQILTATVLSESSALLPQPLGSPDVEGEGESALDKANFLSFEDWKRQNQVKADQAIESGTQQFARDGQRPGINNALDSLGDEGEIELDFSGFGGAASHPRQQQAAYRTAGSSAPVQDAPPSQTPRSKDAGKTCKERTNYASFDCAATVLKSNPECKSASSVLVENKDSYMLNTCSANNKFFIIELCNDILIDTIVLANYEFFSSIFRQFRVSVSERYPVKMDKWRDLGTFEARNSRDVQAFLIEHPQIWTRYLRIEFLSHYGSEYYCPVSLLRVHGTTMLEDLRPQDEISPGESAEDAVTLPVPEETATKVSQEPAASTDEVGKSTLQATSSQSDHIQQPTSASLSKPTCDASTTSPGTSAATSSMPSLMWTLNMGGEITSVAIPAPTPMTCASESFAQSDEPSSKTLRSSQTTLNSSVATETMQSATAFDSSAPEPNIVTKTEGPAVTSTQHVVRAARTEGDGPSMTVGNGTTLHSAASSSGNKAEASDTTSSQADPNGLLQDTNTLLSVSTRSIAHTSSSTSSQAPPQPSTQESFFKSVTKRLQQLEANSTLSLQYIEEQSRILRDAFAKVEKRQILATTTFLANLNTTVMHELHGFRQAYDQIWQSTVIELEGQREHFQHEMLALSARLTLVADELVWQKRMGIVQSTLLLLCLGLVLFARTGQSGYLEVPLVQQMRNKSYSALSRRMHGYDSPRASPSPESRSPATSPRKRFPWRSYVEQSVDTDSRPDSGSNSRPDSKDGLLELPSEAKSHRSVLQSGQDRSQYNFGPNSDEHEDLRPSYDTVNTREVQSGPSTPSGTRDVYMDDQTRDWKEEEVGVT